jgi:hypothetical protein
MDAFYLRNGGLWDGLRMYPSVHSGRGETFLLRWADSESASDDRKYLDIPCDGVEHIADVLFIDESNPVFALFAAANPNDSRSLRGVDNWCKLRLNISSQEYSQQVELLAACGDRGGPISLDYWLPRGEAILEAQLNERKARKAAREQESQPASE